MIGRLIRTLLALGLIFIPVLIMAQTGGIAGTTVDSSGAVVPNVKVTAENVNTNLVRTAKTGDTGAYSITGLPVGNYKVVAEAKGFKTAAADHVVVTVAQTITVNFQMQVGTITEVVDVNSGAVAAVELENSQVSNIVSSKDIESLPMVTRDPYSLVLLSPGTSSTTGLGGFSVNGARDRNNNFLLDGTDNNDTSVPGGAGGLTGLNPEATEEFRVITNNYNAEFGRNNGAIIDIVTKSGTNKFHGDAHWFGRYNALGARDYFNKVEEGKQDPYVRNIFGFGLGGPIKKNKTFFFVNNEWNRFRTTRTAISTVPSAALKQGIITLNDGTTINMNDPADPNNFAAGVFGITGVDPVVQQILSLYPNPNGTMSDGNRGLLYFPTASKFDSWNLTTKLDHRLTDKHNATLRYAYQTSQDPNGFYSDFLPGIGAIESEAKSHNLGINLTSIVTPRFINEVKAGFNRLDAGFWMGGLDTLNAPGSLDSLGHGRDFALVGISGWGSALGASDGQARRTGTYTVADTISWVKGAHSLKFGAEFHSVFEDGYNAFSSRETIGFSAYSSFQVPALNPDLPGLTDGNPALFQDMAWMLTGLVDSQSVSQFFDKTGERHAIDNKKFRQHEYGFYVQDAWKMSRNLTLNLGLRYQFNGVPYEADGNFSNLYVPASGSAPFTFELAGPGSGRLFYNNDFSMIEPRVGLAWDPFGDGKTSIRGGYGIFHDRVFGNLFGNARGNPPFQVDYLDYPSAYAFFGVPGATYAFASSVPFAPTLNPSPTVEQGALLSPVLFDPNLKMPRSHNWSFGIQRELFPTLTAEINYVGSHGQRILRVTDANPPDEAKIQELHALGVPEEMLSSPCLWIGAEYCGFPFNAAANNAFGPTSFNTSIGRSDYNSLQASFSKQMSYGLQLQAAYTWAHAADDSSDALVPGSGSRSFPRNPHHLEQEWGNSDNDIRHRFVIGYTYELPFGKGKQYLGRGFVGTALEGWSLSGITSWQTGHPFEIWGTWDNQHMGRNDRAYLIGNPMVSNPDRTQTGPAFSAFDLQPHWDTVSNLGRNHFYGPRYSDSDVTATKKTKIGEGLVVEFRFEVYNLFNHPQFSQPVNDLSEGEDLFGKSWSVVGRPDGTTSARQCQFGLKLTF